MARFCNEVFYAGQLRILTDVAGLTGTLRGLSWRSVHGTTEKGPLGGALNPEEAAAVVAWVRGHASAV